jgi:hypothetical protein
MYYPRNWHLIATVKAPLTLDERSRLNALKVMFGEKYNRVSRDVHGVIWLEGLPGHMLQLGANSFPTLENGKMINLDGEYEREVGVSHV